ncbi:MAG: acetate--CoA ligase family protein [Ignavibacteriaceae bacterium]|jgi:acetyltransferase|nr:MAG: CoA-binding protein [Chlorobiota bacterium]KXK05774.1 MAG: acetyl-CoA synthetase [Chlorobi bacterium OLB4]MBV6398394.1 Protein lysine acetyltransferase Pka [Ignavibacteria bacterium]MCC6886014.1 acetate--CoA ligase family protein [Ignavibacteriales bacterium]MCE7952736.1 CoA-binding protein [Chlorobi bacterium CHB7]MDL1886846.1 CoA-binding protein [Ignavibacteria bacterium CHB1]MEB2330244.1 acetate--CoA ligase family protein [Ignavibacteriaceae bacterium]OQY77877.1 MAG: CoA ligase [I
MINSALQNPASIAVIGASENTGKPGGKVLLNLIKGNFKGNIFAVNPKPVNIRGAIHVPDISGLPHTDLAIISIPAKSCIEAVEKLSERGTKAFIIFSAGFSEAGNEGRELEIKLREIIDSYNSCLIGPNCIGMVNQNFKGVFTTPLHEYDPMGCELISSSGATAVFIIEAAQSTGLKFSNIYSIGNAVQTGAEDILEFMDETYEHGKSPRVKLLYLEQIKHPVKFIKHTSSLIRKGCYIAAIKSGYSESGSRAASSHTGAMATSDSLIRALFKKAGIVYCSSREELISVACIWQNKELKGNNIAIITHAGGSAVMLTDTLTSLGMNVPQIPTDSGRELLPLLHPGSSVNNPIDFLATGTAEQLGIIIDFCEKLKLIDGMVVVFGSAGLFNVQSAYDKLDEKMKTCEKPIYTVLPSLVNAREEIDNFISKGHINFSDEVVLGKALAHSYLKPKPTYGLTEIADMDITTIREVISEADTGYLSTSQVRQILQSAGLDVVNQRECFSLNDLTETAKSMSFPLALKVIGPIHKTDVGGVSLNINSDEILQSEFERMMKIKGVKGVLVQETIYGKELYCGAMKENKYGHLILCGLGGIFVEVINDIAYGLAPLNKDETSTMIKSLKGYPIIKGFRNRNGVNEDKFIDAVVRISSLVYVAPEITELDVNPFIGNPDRVVSVDARIKLAK